MAFVVPNGGESSLLRRIVGLDTNGNLLLRLYVTKVSLGEGTTFASLTECTTSGYSAKTLTTTSWVINTASGQTTASYGEQVFTLNAGVSVWGYFVTDLSNNLILVEEFTTAPFIIPSTGGQVAITPTMNLE
jgi:hypothetical protein